MLRDERLNFIENYVIRYKFVSFQDLMHVLDISKATVRRDLQKLSDDGRISLVRGGASSKNSAIIAELPYDQAQEQYEAEKMRIAQAAAEMVKPGDTIILDSGTTVRKMVPFLAPIHNLKILTSDIAIASDFSYYPNVNVTVTGGTLRQGYFNLVGYYAESLMGSLHADIAFVSVATISPSGDCMIANLEEVGIKKKILTSANRNVMLCDHSKFGIDTMASVCKISDISLFVTGRELPDDTLDQYQGLSERLLKV